VMMRELLRWQKEIILSIENRMRTDDMFVVNVATGGGKTWIGGYLALRHKPSIVVCPTVVLARQWDAWFRERGIEPGFIGDGCMDVNRDGVNIGVINSIVNNIYIMPQFAMGIYDEAHNYGGTYQRAFNISRTKVLLTATPTEWMKGYKQIANVTLNKLIDNKIVDDYIATLIGVDLTLSEQKEYNYYDRLLRQYLDDSGIATLQTAFKLIGLSSGKMSHVLRDIAKTYQNMIRISAMSEGKDELITEFAKDSDENVIVFCNYIEQARRIHERLLRLGIDSILITGKDSKKQRREKLRRASNTKALVTTKILDEGWTPEVPFSIGIIASATGQKRQLIQRIGRTIRHYGNGHRYIIDVVARGTVDERLARRRWHSLGNRLRTFIV